jgi:hypothetical protein
MRGRNGKNNLVLSRRTPIRKFRRISNALLETVCSECADRDAGCAIEATDCPEWRHCGQAKCLQEERMWIWGVDASRCVGGKQLTWCGQ